MLDKVVLVMIDAVVDTVLNQPKPPRLQNQSLTRMTKVKLRSSVPSVGIGSLATKLILPLNMFLVSSPPPTWQ